MKRLDEKTDLNAMLPYLSAYMGPSNFSDTAYYIHLMPENLLASAAVDWEKLDALIPAVAVSYTHLDVYKRQRIR